MVAFSDFFFYPDYYGLFTKVAFELPAYYRDEPVHKDGFLGEVRTYCNWEWADVQLLVVLALCWTIFRWALTRFVLQVRTKPCLYVVVCLESCDKFFFCKCTKRGKKVLIPLLTPFLALTLHIPGPHPSPHPYMFTRNTGLGPEWS